MLFDKHVKRGHPITFGFLIFFAFIEMIQVAVLIASYNRNDDFPSSSIRDRLKFLLFLALWTLFFGAAYIYGFLAAASNFAFSIASHGGWLILTWIFWLAGAASITSALGGGLNCGAMPEGFGHCNQLNAAEAFAWICWIINTFLVAVVAVIAARSARSGNGFGAPLLDV